MGHSKTRIGKTLPCAKHGSDVNKMALKEVPEQAKGTGILTISRDSQMGLGQ